MNILLGAPPVISPGTPEISPGFLPKIISCLETPFQAFQFFKEVPPGISTGFPLKVFAVNFILIFPTVC